MTGLGYEVYCGLPANVDSSVSLSGPPSLLCVQKLPHISIWGWVNIIWIITGRTDAEALVFWSPDTNSWFMGKVTVGRKDWVQKKKRVSEDDLAGWHHWCNAHKLGQSPGDSEGQRGSGICCPWGHKESDTTGQLNNNLSAKVFWKLKVAHEFEALLISS